MQDIIKSEAQTMTSREMAELTEKRHDSVKRTIESLANSGVISLPQIVEYLDGLGRSAQEYKIGKRDSYVIVAQLSPEFTARLVDRWQELENAVAAPKPLTQAEMMLQAAKVLVEIERRQEQQEKALLQIETRVEQVAQTQLLTSRPQNAEAITRIRERCTDQFGLPSRIIDQIIRQSPYAPKPAGMVRNENDKADGATYAVYWTKDINDVLRRFCKECTMVTATFATHPLIEGRFKYVKAST